MDLNELYQELILDHNRHPHNVGRLDDATATAEGYNPLCGDRLTVYLKVRDGRIEDVRFEGEGCAISVASASMMTDAVKGKTVEEAERLFRGFRTLVMGEEPAADDERPDLGKLTILEGVKSYPSRVKCATLAWHTLDSALHGKGSASTE